MRVQVALQGFAIQFWASFEPVLSVHDPTPVVHNPIPYVCNDQSANCVINVATLLGGVGGLLLISGDRSHTRLLFWRQFASTGLCLSASRAAGRILTSTFIRVAKRGRRRSTKPAIPKGGRQCANMLPHWDYLAQRSHRADRGRRRGVFAATYLAARRPVASLAECLGYLYEVITSKYHFLTCH